jgi:hypothetical protein
MGDSQIMARQVELVITEFSKCTDPERLADLEQELFAFSQNPDCCIPVICVALEQTDISLTMLKWCLQTLSLYVSVIPDQDSIFERCLLQMHRAPEQPVLGLLAENMAALIRQNADFLLRCNSLPLEVLPALLSRFLNALYDADSSNHPDPRAYSRLVLGVLKSANKDADWFKLYSVAGRIASWSDFRDILDDMIPILTPNFDNRLRHAFCEWLNEVLVTELWMIVENPATAEFFKSAIRLVLVFATQLLESCDNWEFASAIIGQVLEIGMEYWGDEVLADLARDVFAIVVDVLRVFARESCRELFILLSTFARAVSMPMSDSMVNPAEFMCAGLELIVELTDHFDELMERFGKEVIELEETLHEAIEDLTDTNDMEEAKEQIGQWLRHLVEQRFSSGVCYVISHAHQSFRDAFSSHIADRLITLPADQLPSSALDFIARCSAERTDLSPHWFEILGHLTTAPLLHRAAAALAALTKHEPQVFLTDDLKHVFWVVQLLDAQLTRQTSVHLMSALIRIAYVIPEAHPRLQDALMATGRVFVDQVQQQPDLDDLTNWILPVLKAATSRTHHALLGEFAAGLIGSVQAILEPYWHRCDTLVQMSLAMIVHAAINCGWWTDQAFLVAWLQHIVVRQPVNEHIPLILECCAEEPIEPLWTMLHVFNFPFPKDACHHILVSPCLDALTNLVERRPELARHCSLPEMLHGLQVKRADVVCACARILAVVAKTRPDSRDILRASVGALAGWQEQTGLNPVQLYRTEVGLRLFKLWRTIGIVSGDPNAVAQFVLKWVELRIGAVNPDLRWVLTCLEARTAPSGFREVADRSLRAVVERLRDETA